MNRVSVILVGIVYLLAEPGLIAVLAKNSSETASEESSEQNVIKYHVDIADAGTVEIYCAGSIVGKRWILTLLECVESSEFRIIFNDFSIDLDFTSVYAYPSQYENVGMVELPQDLAFNSNLGAVSYSLPNDAKKLDGKKGSLPATNMLMARLPETYTIMSPQECQQNAFGKFDSNRQLCARAQDFDGISNIGSGLTIEDKDGPILVGLLLYPVSPMGPPATFIKVSAYEEWINKAVTGKLTSEKT